MDDALDLNVEPNQFELEEEWVKQPKLRLKWGQALADEKREVNRIKDRLAVVEAELSLDVRARPGVYGLDKLTEAVIAAVVKKDHKRCSWSDKLIAAQHEMDMVQAAVSAIDHRKSALGDLVALYLADYYAKPKAPHADREQIEDMEKRAIRGGGRDR